MKKFGILVSIAFVVLSFSAVSAQEKYEADVANSTITWKGYKPTGSHNGTIDLQSGTLEMDGQDLAGGSFVVAMSSLKDADGSGRLEGHLKSKDFFEIESDIKLDGELYNHQLKADFNKITSLVRKVKPTVDEEAECRSKVQYHVYDMFTPEHEFPFNSRNQFLKQHKHFQDFDHKSKVQLVNSLVKFVDGEFKSTVL